MVRKNTENDLDMRFRWAIDSLQSIQDESIKNVFDIGSGKQLLKEKLVAAGMNYTAFDIYPPNEMVKEWNVDNPCPSNEKADLVVFLEVIEHLNNPWLGIKNISDTIRPGGFLLLSTPNPTWSESRVNMFGKGVLTMFTPHDLEVNHHVFTPWKHILLQILADNGFKILRFDNLGSKTIITSYPFWGLKLPFRLIYRTIKVLMEKNDPGSIGPLYGIVAQKI